MIRQSPPAAAGGLCRVFRGVSMSRITGAALAAFVLALPAAAQTRPTPNKPGEPLLKEWSPQKAAEFLDGVGLNWTREKQCGTCHTNYPYLLGRAALPGPKSEAADEVRRFFEGRAANWDKAKPRWDTEVVATASTLAIHDSLTTGKLHPVTKSALDRMWTLQRPDGSWNWLKCDWPPQEHDDYFGAAYAALGVGLAPDGYASGESARAGLEKLRNYFRTHQPPDLHHRTWLLWASAKLPGLMTDDDRHSAVKELKALQRDDGGWSLPSLGDWKRRDGSANDKSAGSDGYATGLVVYVLLQSGVKKDDEAVKRGAAWLRAHQTESGRWFTRSLNNDKAHYITNAGTALAVLALSACE